jgi:O-acetylhomoserine (thiol)-lyase
MERHLENTHRVAAFLEADERVGTVTWASLPSSPHHERARRYLPRGAGSVLGFELPGGLEAGRRFVDALSLHSHVANIGDVRSLVIHPASTTHSQLSEEEQRAAGVAPGFVRLSVGIEHIDDILADIEQGLAAATA